MSMNAGKKKEGRGRKLRMEKLLYHNGFVLAASFVIALVMWFVVAKDSDLNGTKTVYDVPITVNLSAEAEAEGLRVFNMSYKKVDIQVSGSAIITSKLTADDFEVIAALNPVSTKLTGNTTQKINAQVRVSKKTELSDYEVVGLSPEEVVLEYDRYKEVSLAIENDIDFTAATGFFPGTPVLSEERVNISGPESSVNKISRVAVAYRVEDPLRESTELTCPLRFYDQDGQEITDTAVLYLTADVDSVQATIPVLPKKTVPLMISWAHKPASFSDTRITIEPETIDIAGSAETLGNITEIRLDQVIDFAELNMSQSTATYTMEIPVPANTRNITNTGTNTLSQATVTINLNGYKRTTVTVPENNIEIINAPAGDLSAVLATRTMDVVLAGPEAQVSKLTGESVTVQLDMSNVPDREGSVDVPATVNIAGSAGEACWVLGSYTVAVDLTRSSQVENGVTAVLGQDMVAKPPSE